MEKINIAIDGAVGSGKTTIGKLLAKKINLHFLDSGLLYRYFALFCRKSNLQQSAVEESDEEKLHELVSAWKNELVKSKTGELIFQLEAKRQELSSQEISDLASRLAPMPKLREIILNFQRQLTADKGWVVVGRDITSEILPQAEIKIFLTASLEERVKRRHSQQPQNTSLEKVKNELLIRDERDKNRKKSPLKKTADSWELDTTHLSLEESVEKILLHIRKKQKNRLNI